MFIIASSLSLALGTPLILLAVLKNQKLLFRIVNLTVGLISVGFFIYINYIMSATAKIPFSLILFIIPALLIIVNILDNYKVINIKKLARKEEKPALAETPKFSEVAVPVFTAATPARPQATVAPKPQVAPTVDSKPQVATPVVIPSQARTAASGISDVSKPEAKPDEKFVLPDFF